MMMNFHKNYKTKDFFKNVTARRFSAFFADFSLKNSIFHAFFIIFCGFSLFFAISCSSSKIEKIAGKNQKKLSPVHVTNSKKINLLKNSEFLENDGKTEKIDVMQLISGSFSHQNFEFLANLTISGEEISLSILSAMGTDVGNISYQNNSVDFHSDFFPKNVKAEYIIADIQNAYFPFENLRQNFEKAGLTFTQEIQPNFNQNSNQNDEKQAVIRRIYDKNQLIETISVFNDIITIENHLRNYKYVLQTLDEIF